MKIAVLGATGATGQRFIELAMANGHEIRALARKPDSLARFEGISVVQGDALDVSDIDRTLEGQDAVLSSLGLSAAGSNREVVTVCTTAMTHVLDAMRRFDQTRLVAVSTHGVSDSHDGSPYVTNLWNAMGERLRDKETMEALITPSEVDWTVVRAPRISDDEESGNYRVGRRIGIAPDGFIGRPDLARFLLSEFEVPQHSYEVVSIAV